MLVREHRIAAQAQLLRALDLAVPVGALDQPHHQPQPVQARDASHLVDHCERSRLVGLHREPEAAPLRRCGADMRGERFDQIQRQLEAIALLGVDRQVEIRRGGGLDQRQHARQQLGEHALALQLLVAREQRPQLDRDAVAGFGRWRRAARCDGLDRMPVRRQIASCVGIGARAFAEHVVREAQRRLLSPLRGGLVHRLIDRAAEHELPPEQLDRAHRRRNNRLRAEALQQAGLAAVGRQQPLRPGDRACRQLRQHAVRAVIAVATAAVERGAAELVGGQRDRRLGVGHAQQRFGEPHQRQPFGAGDRVLAQQRFERPERRGLLAHATHPRRCLLDHGTPVECAVEATRQCSDDVHLVSVWVGQTGWRHGAARDWGAAGLCASPSRVAVW